MDAAKNPMVQAHQLGKRYGPRLVFRNVNFEVAHGTVAAIVGHNGAGKSTLLRLVATLEQPAAGRLEWHEANGQNVEAENARWHCGLSAPDAPLYRELTVGENLQFWSGVRGESADLNVLKAHLEGFELATRWNDLAGDLSSGLRARLQLAVATLHKPSFLLLDEPGANFDRAGRDILERILQEQRARGCALVATNDVREAQLCDTRIEL